MIKLSDSGRGKNRPQLHTDRLLCKIYIYIFSLEEIILICLTSRGGLENINTLIVLPSYRKTYENILGSLTL